MDGTIIVKEEMITPEQFNELRENVGLGTKDLEKSRISLTHSIYIVTLWDSNLLIGMGRIMGDGSLYYTINDIAVRKEYQGHGYSKIIMQKIEEFLIHNTDENANIKLFAIPPADNLYRQFHFVNFGENLIGMTYVNNDSKNH